MNRSVQVLLLLAFLGCLHVWVLNHAAVSKKLLPVSESDAYVLPAPLLKAAALEYRAVVADALLLKSLVFFGATMERGGAALALEDREWQYLFEQLQASSVLDPHFLDPYYIAGGVLTGTPAKVEEVNRFLEKGAHNRSWDWFLPFLVGWHKFYYLQDNRGAAEFLMEAYRRNEQNSVLATLAARLAYVGNRTETAILFLQEILGKTEDPKLRKTYETRLQALIAINILEKAAMLYQQRRGVFPTAPEELLNAGILAILPDDPYGGKFFFKKDGSVGTTSNLIEK